MEAALSFFSLDTSSDTLPTPFPLPPSSDPHSFVSLPPFPPFPSPSSLPHRPQHRRAHSDVGFRLPDHIFAVDDSIPDISEPFLCSDKSSDSLFPSYLSSVPSEGPGTSQQAPGVRNLLNSAVDVPAEICGTNGEIDAQRAGQKTLRPPRHRHSMSMDGSLTVTEDIFMGDIDSLETKKASDCDQMAELDFYTDPRRARRILANRLSAARSKERKLRYVADLEERVQTLEKEATLLSAQLSMLQRDSKDLSTENSELKLRLQSMEQQAQLHDALNDTLKEEVRWLKSMTVHMSVGNGHAFVMDTL